MSKFLNFIKQMFSDERDRVSSKRAMGVICTLTLCATLYHNSFTTTEFAPAESLVDSVALLAFGCLGLTSIDKFISAKNGGNKDENPKSE